MKRFLVPFLIVFMSIATVAQDPAQARIPGTVGVVVLIAPADEASFNKIPINIEFSWNKPPGVTSYTLEIQGLTNQTWSTLITRTNLTTNSVTVNFDQPVDLRWRVLGVGTRGARFLSPWWHLRYKGSGEAINQGKTVIGEDGQEVSGSHVENKPTPQFRPVLLKPKNEVVLRHYPRNMTFKWMHSTKPAYRRYQIQVDIYHPNPQKWQSAMRNGKLLVDEVITDNEYHYKFPADRIGRWRVRGVKDPRTFTPWSPWRKFSFRARH